MIFKAYPRTPKAIAAMADELHSAQQELTRLRAENEALRKDKTFTPFEVHQVAVFNYRNQSGHPGNWDSFGKFIPRAIDQLRHTQEQITAAMNQGKDKQT